jgi:Carboxypeptidase regulatory-like domain
MIPSGYKGSFFRAGRTIFLCHLLYLLSLGAGATAKAGNTNYIKNPDFSEGLTDYTTGVVAPGFFPDYPQFDVESGAPCFPGASGSFLGIDVPGGADGYVEQEVTLPDTPTTFSFTTWGNLDPVTATISVVHGGVLTVLDTYTPPTLQADDAGDCTGNKPIVKSYNLSAYAGQTITVRMEATSGGDDGTIADFTNLSIMASPLVQGTVNDVVLNFPSRTFPSIDLALPGATVQLLDASGTQVAETTTDSSGNYQLNGTVPNGTYTVEFSKDANLYSSASNSYTQAPVKQVRTVTLDGTGPVMVNVNLPVSIVSEAAIHEYALNNLPLFAGLTANPFHYNTTAIEGHISDILATSPPLEFTKIGTIDDWNSIIRIDAAMEALSERASDAVLLANDGAKALGLWSTYLAFKKLGPGLFGANGYFAPKTRPLMKSQLAAAANAFKIAGLAFGVNYILQPLLVKFNVPTEKRAEIVELYAKAVRFGFDLIISKMQVAGDFTFEVIFQAIRYEIFQIIVSDYVTNTQPSLDTAAIQFAHNAISGDTATTLAAVSSYDSQLSDFTKCLDGITETAFGDKSLLRAVTGISTEAKDLLWSSSSLSASKFAINMDEALTFLKAPVEAAIETAFAAGSIAPLIGEALSIDPTAAVITASMTGPDALPPTAPSCPSVSLPFGRSTDQEPLLAAVMSGSTPTPTPTAVATATPVPLPSAVQSYLTELSRVSKILAAKDVAGYNAETPKLLAANNALFQYLNPVGQRALAALPQLSATGISDTEALVPNFDIAADDAGLFYLATELWTISQDSNSLNLATSFATDVASDLTTVGPQAASVQNDLKGVTVPGQIVITGDGVPGDWTTAGSNIIVSYTFTNVGGKALPAGTVMLLPDTDISLLSGGTISMPALAAGGTFLASWEFKAVPDTAIGFGHYQIDATVAGAQPVSLDELFVITGGPNSTPTPTPTPIPTHAPTRTPIPTPTSTPVPGTPTISNIPRVILVGSTFNIEGTGFTAGSLVNFFIATGAGLLNAGPLTPSSPHSATLLTVKVPSTTPLGEGFVSVQVVNVDTGFKTSNLGYALLQGSAAAGIPTISSVNGLPLDPTSSNPSYAVDNVATVVAPGKTVTIGGSGFDSVHGVEVDLFTSAGKVKYDVSPLSSTSISFLIPASGPNAPVTGPGSFVVVNLGNFFASNAVSVAVGEAISLKSITQSGDVITVNGTGFSSLTVINLFNMQHGRTVNLGGYGAKGTPNIPLTLVDSDRFTFEVPAKAVPGPCYVQAIEPPFTPFSSSGNDPGGAFTLK